MKVEMGRAAMSEAVELGGVGAAKARSGIAEPRVWIVVVANSGQSFWARDNLKAELVKTGLDFEIYLPVYLHNVKDGQAELRPFLERYFFVKVSLDVDAWRFIFSVKGIKSVLGVRNGHAYGVKDRFVDTIRAHEEEGFIKLGLVESRAAPKFSPGQKVTYGTVEALFQAPDGRRRGWIIINMFGKDHRNLVDLRDLREAEAG